MKTLFKKIFLISIVLLVPLSIVFALELDWPPSPMGTDLTDASTLTDLTKYLYEWGIALGGLAAFIALLIAGFLYLTSVGDPQKMADARGRIVWALAGLVLLLASWLILNTINPDLTTLMNPDLPAAWEFLLCDTDADCRQCNDTTPNDDNKNGRCIYSPDIACDINDDCSIIKCTDQNQGDGNKQGVCAPPKGDKPPCDYARVWKKRYFDSSGANVIADIDINTDIPNQGPGSVKAFFYDSDYDKKCSGATTSTACAAIPPNPDGSPGSPPCEWRSDQNKCYQFCGRDGCGCMLEIYDVGTPCSDKLMVIQSYASDLSLYSEKDSWYGDGRPDCVRLEKPSY